MRVDIPEGARFDEMPRCGYGRILSYPTIEEWYVTLRLFGRRLFIASGKYHFHDHERSVRWHLDRDCT